MLRKSVLWMVCLVLVLVLSLPAGGAEGLKVHAQEPAGEEDVLSPPTMVSSDGKRSKPLSAESGEEVSAQGRIEDEEVAVIMGNMVSVWDPRPADAQNPMSFQVAEGTGWRDIATGDFDGNGDQEIVVIDNYGWVRVYNPGGPPMGFEFSKSYAAALGRAWIRVATGDTDGDGRDEIIVVSNTINDSSLVYVIDPKDGNEPNQGMFFGGVWYYVAAGQFYGDGRAEVALAEYYNDDRQAYFYLWDPWNPMTVIYGQQWRGRYLGLAMGDMDKDGFDETVLTRSGKHEPSLLGFDYYPPQIKVYDLGFNFPGWGDEIGDEDNPGWGYIDFGDITGNGDDELVAVRGIPEDAPDDFENFMIKDPFPWLEPGGNPSEAYYFDPPIEWQGVKSLDYDGDGVKEVVLRRDNYVQGYDWVVPGGDIYSFGAQAFVANLSGMAVGEFETPVLKVTPEEVLFLMDRSNKNLIPPEQRFQVNITSGEFGWSAVYSPTLSWLNVLPTSGSDPAFVGVSVIKTAVSTDTERVYTGLITVTASSEVYSSPKVVTVTLEVLDDIFNVYGPYVSRQ